MALTWLADIVTEEAKVLLHVASPISVPQCLALARLVVELLQQIPETHFVPHPRDCQQPVGQPHPGELLWLVLPDAGVLEPDVGAARW